LPVIADKHHQQTILAYAISKRVALAIDAKQIKIYGRLTKITYRGIQANHLFFLISLYFHNAATAHLNVHDNIDTDIITFVFVFSDLLESPDLWPIYAFLLTRRLH
jgi:hypothetical protein